jgi:hypothetical protein
MQDLFFVYAGEGEDFQLQYVHFRIPCDAIWEQKHQRGEALFVPRFQSC